MKSNPPKNQRLKTPVKQAGRLRGLRPGNHGHPMSKLPSPKLARPIIRPGQRVPYQKGKPEEIARRRKYVARLLARKLGKMEIHRRTKRRFNRQWRTVDRDIEFIGRASKLEGVS